MGIIAVIIIGGIVGWLASLIMGRHEGILASIVIGIIGAFIGGFVSRLFTGTDQAFLGFSWAGFFWSLIGAVILVAILNAFSHPRRHPV
jgi:uncharacterized membrane protein YeaQ/YmgE (transglycosylase-associated protein family)